MTPSRQECDHPTSSSSSSTSPSTTVLSDSETQEREDLSGIVSHTVPVSSSHVEEMIERRDPLCSDIPEWLQEFRENLVDDRVPEHRDSHASSSHELSLREVWIWVNTVFILTSRKTKIARSVRGRKSRGPRAEDAMAEPYLVQKSW